MKENSLEIAEDELIDELEDIRYNHLIDPFAIETSHKAGKLVFEVVNKNNGLVVFKANDLKELQSWAYGFDTGLWTGRGENIS